MAAFEAPERALHGADGRRLRRRDGGLQHGRFCGAKLKDYEGQCFCSGLAGMIIFPWGVISLAPMTILDPKPCGRLQKLEL